MSLKTTSSEELRAKLTQLQESEKVLANAGMPFPEELASIKAAIENELKTRIGDIVADATAEDMKGYYASKFAGQRFETEVTIVHSIKTNAETGELEVSVSAKGKATRTPSAGGGTGSRGPVTRKQVEVNGIVYNSASEALKALKEQKLVQETLGNADSAVRVLQRVANTRTDLVIKFIEVEATAETDGDATPPTKGKK